MRIAYHACIMNHDAVPLAIQRMLHPTPCLSCRRCANSKSRSQAQTTYPPNPGLHSFSPMCESDIVNGYTGIHRWHAVGNCDCTEIRKPLNRASDEIHPTLLFDRVPKMSCEYLTHQRYGGFPVSASRLSRSSPFRPRDRCSSSIVYP